MNFEARNLTVQYRGAAVPALEGVDMTVPTGTLYAVLGPNGSGKSTLMRTLLGIIPPTSGSVEVGGRPTRMWSRRALARAVGAVPQAEHLAFPMSVRDFVAMGRYPHLGPFQQENQGDRAIVSRAMGQCEVLELGSRDVTTLSGGELQRVRIARALAQEPSALALDEPTASLDIRHEMSIFHLLAHSVSSGMTVLLITHHLNLAARFASRFLLLSEGRVAAEGAAQEVFKEAVLEEVYGWPVEVRRDPGSGSPHVVPLQEPAASSTNLS